MATASIRLPGWRSNNLIGRRFGLLVVTEYFETRNKRVAIWKCRCDCGKEDHLAQGGQLLIGNVTSCGCHKSALCRKAATTHGQCYTAEHQTWASIKKRTRDPNDVAYPRYGGRGITMCDEWYNSYEAFRRDVGPRTNGCTLDRIDNNKGYCKENCRWATWTEQARNRRSNVYLEFGGERLTKAAWAERYKIHPQVLSKRLKAGKSIEEAITMPLREHKKSPRHFGREPEDFVTG